MANELLGPPPLGARPDGLLDLLGIKSGGAYPQYLTPQLLPVFQLGRWYMEDAAQLVAVNFAVSAIGTTQTVATVPQTECWALLTVNLATTSQINALTTRLQVAMQLMSPVNQPALTLAATPISVAGDLLCTGLVLPELVIAGPGSVIQAQSVAYAGSGSTTVLCSVRYARCSL